IHGEPQPRLSLSTHLGQRGHSMSYRRRCSIAKQWSRAARLKLEEAMAFDYDILIAGAGPAGCAAAYDLARAGKRVLLLDRRSFPRPKACACGLTRKTLKALRYSVDPVIERVC